MVIWNSRGLPNLNHYFDQSPLYKLHKDYPLLMPSTWKPRSFKMINHGFIEIRHVVKTDDEKIIVVVSPRKFDTCIAAILTQVRKLCFQVKCKHYFIIF